MGSKSIEMQLIYAVVRYNHNRYNKKNRIIIIYYGIWYTN